MKRVIEDRFPILNAIRAVDTGDRNNATMSIGVSPMAASLHESETISRQALDMALGRGGDQVALRQKNGYEFLAAPAAGWKSAIRCAPVLWPTPLPKWPPPAIISSSWATALPTWTAWARPLACTPAFPHWASPVPLCWIPKRAWRSRCTAICCSRINATRTPLFLRRRGWIWWAAIPCWW